MKLTHSLVLGVSILQAASLYAAEAPLTVSASVDLTDGSHRGTFFELMGKKIKPALDADYAKPVRVTDVRTFHKKSSNFSHIGEMASKFKGGAQGLEAAVGKLSGKSIAVDRMYGAVMGAMNGLYSGGGNQSRVAGALVPIVGLTSGKGVLVELDSKTYVYNYGYAQGSGGSDLEADKESRKTGRSYGASAARGAYDPSDNDYLRELAVYAAKADEKELERFYTTVFSILLKSDTSGIKNLAAEGQTVLADYMAIYMAELDRHMMTGLQMYEWENALTEITMLAAYSADRGGATLDPRSGVDNASNDRGLVASSELQPKDRLTGFFGVGTDGSGLDGKNKQRRHVLTKKITSEQRKLNAALVAKIERLAGIRAGGADVYDSLMNAVNSLNGQAAIKKNADQLIDALVEFLMATRSKASTMVIL